MKITWIGLHRWPLQMSEGNESDRDGLLRLCRYGKRAPFPERYNVASLRCSAVHHCGVPQKYASFLTFVAPWSDCSLALDKMNNNSPAMTRDTSSISSSAPIHGKVGSHASSCSLPISCVALSP